MDASDEGFVHAHSRPVTPLRAMPWAARIVISLFERIRVGSLRVTLPDARRLSFGSPNEGVLHAEIVINDWRVFGATLRGGDVAFAERYLRGEWSTPDLAALLLLFARNRDAIEGAVYGSALSGAIVRFADRVRHLLRANSRRGSRRNIAAHYDLGNAFYALWLDATMTYSSAMFDVEARATQSLDEAQIAKLERVLRLAEVHPGERILEIGCGWGSFAALAAERGVHVSGLSLSQEQLRYATARLAATPHAARAHFEYRDYRDYRADEERFDAVVSIEMIEAVGERYWPAYFQSIAARLRPGGRAVVQAITIDPKLFDRYRVGSDFIQQYIFPGGMLAPPERWIGEAARAGLGLVDRFSFGRDYAETLRRWRHAFTRNVDRVRALGFDERFLRMWTFYLAYCEAAFDAGCTDVCQLTFVRQP